MKFFKDIKLEIISKSGIVPRKSYVGHSSTFDLLWEITCLKLFREGLDVSNMSNLKEFAEKYKNNFINTFMSLHHKYIVEPTKFNWNWD